MSCRKKFWGGLLKGRISDNKTIIPYLQLDYFDVGTPLSNKYYLGCPSGEIYGLNHVTQRVKPESIMELRPETEVPGLYLTGKQI